MELVQHHERVWGQEQYPNRPSLHELISAPIVAMWAKVSILDPKKTAQNLETNQRPMLTAHQNWEEIDEMLTSIVLLGNTSPVANWKLSRVYLNQQAVKVRVQLQVLED